MPAPAISVRDLTVRYGSFVAVDALSLEVARGEVFGFLGPNGAGKTTTIRALLDLLRPDAGRVEIFGEPVRDGDGALRRRIGFLPGDLALFPELSGRRTLDLFARLHGRAPVRRDEVLEGLGFPRHAFDRPVRSYSTGMRQMIGVAAAFQHAPELLVLDEPTTGLDPLVRAAFLRLVRATAERGDTVLFSSHVLAEVDEAADRVGLVYGGRLHLVEEVASLKRRLPKRVRLLREDGSEEVFDHEGGAAELALRLGAMAEELADFDVEPANLDEVFRRVVEGRDT